MSMKREKENNKRNSLGDTRVTLIKANLERKRRENRERAQRDVQ